MTLAFQICQKSFRVHWCALAALIVHIYTLLLNIGSVEDIDRISTNIRIQILDSSIDFQVNFLKTSARQAQLKNFSLGRNLSS